MIINEGDLDAYELKTQELYQMLKFSIFSEQEILKKIHHIELFVSFKKLKDFVQPLKSEKILKIAKELQPLYEALWDIKSEKEVQKKYHQLSFKTKQIYPEFEVNDDWKCRQYAKQKYESMISSLENQRFWLDDLKEQFKLYQEQQIVFPDRQEYLLNWDQILNQYKDQLLSIGEIDLHQVPSHPSNNQVAFVDFHMIACPKGSFWMHRIDDDLKPHQSQNQHKVNLSRGAWIGETPVTQALWQAVMKWNPSIHQGDLLPVVNVTWYDCLAFCNQLSKLEQLQPCFKFQNLKKKDNHIIKAIVEWDQNANGYRLPTEAEWLYCAKASQDYIYSGSNEIAEVACYDQSHLNCTKQYEMSPVKNYKANGWGLYDMSGNVWEWCMDKWDGDSIKNRENPILWDSKPCSHVMRGGSYLSTADQCQLKFRSKNIVDQASDRGFRLFRSIHF